MNIILWITQGILTLMFLMAGSMKMSLPKAKLKEKVGDWVDQTPLNFIKTIGALEILGAIGLILPQLLDILPSLAIIAAIGLGLTMIGAIFLHQKRKEFKSVLTNLFLLALILFVIVGRTYLIPIL
ncbi:DoxX family protein [Crocinitomix algicola]|uniref:DoxX family protein n=1 Tax=Crocinitomix algicola TaxID=1740263 RepID=UPI0008733DD3|nr:DoxX family protein [Crocinitomix algicola]